MLFVPLRGIPWAIPQAEAARPVINNRMRGGGEGGSSLLNTPRSSTLCVNKQAEHRPLVDKSAFLIGSYRLLLALFNMHPFLVFRFPDSLSKRVCTQFSCALASPSLVYIRFDFSLTL